MTVNGVKLKDVSRAERVRLKHLAGSDRPGADFALSKLINDIQQRIIEKIPRKQSKTCVTNRVATRYH